MDTKKSTHAHSNTRTLTLHLGTREASLPLSLKLVPPTTSIPVQVIQCILLCWTYGLLVQNQNKLDVIVFLLHQPSRDRDAQHIY